MIHETSQRGQIRLWLFGARPDFCVTEVDAMFFNHTAVVSMLVPHLFVEYTAARDRWLKYKSCKVNLLVNLLASTLSFYSPRLPPLYSPSHFKSSDKATTVDMHTFRLIS